MVKILVKLIKDHIKVNYGQTGTRLDSLENGGITRVRLRFLVRASKINLRLSSIPSNHASLYWQNLEPKKIENQGD